MSEPLRILCLFDYLLHVGDAFKFDKFLSIISERNSWGELNVCHVKSLSGSFDFRDIHKFDILFLFGMSSKPDDYPDAIAEITKFMAAGKGLFGTGDHGSLGLRLCGNVPRLRFMREWASNPAARSADRLTTTRPTGQIESKYDQSDKIPQRLYPYMFENNRPHYLLQTNYEVEVGKSYINFLPDHAHEGECRVPAVNSPIYRFEQEFPRGAKIEAVAKSMSAGAAVTEAGYLAVAPREFISISVYDGFKSGVGRIVCDATWHHFLDINLKGFVECKDPESQQIYERIRRYYTNIVMWLAPPIKRKKAMDKIFEKTLNGYPYAEVEHELSSTYSQKSIERHGQLFESTLRSSLEMSDAQIEEYVAYLLQSNTELKDLIKYMELAKEIDNEQPYIPGQKIFRHILFGELIFRNTDLKFNRSENKSIASNILNKYLSPFRTSRN